MSDYIKTEHFNDKILPKIKKYVDDNDAKSYDKTEVDDLLNDKQDTLIPGDGIEIDATNNEISVDDTIQRKLTAGDNISIDPATNEISASGAGVPAGGTTGQVLTKKSDTDEDVEWQTPASGAGVPVGGTTGQSLVKKSDDDLDIEWADVESVPAGGTTGQVLTKKSDTDADVEWQTPAAGAGVPAGGTTGQALVKKSDDDLDIEWADVDGSTIQVDVLPAAEASLEGVIYQYVGTTTAEHTNGYFYQCIEVTPATDPKTYEWVRKNVQDPGAGGVPDGGTAGQALVKKSNADQDLEWGNVPKVVSLTQAEYDALSDEEKKNGTIYFITDGSGGGSYVLPPATTSTLGGIKVGDGLKVETDGTLSADTLPAGGTAGQSLIKKTDDDGDVVWATVGDSYIGRWEKLGEWLESGGPKDYTVDMSGYNAFVFSVKRDDAYGWYNSNVVLAEDFEVGKLQVRVYGNSAGPLEVTIERIDATTIRRSYVNGGAATGLRMYGYKDAAVSDSDAYRIASLVNPIPAGGLTGQVLTKKSDADRDADWQTPVADYSDLTGTPTLNGVDIIGDKTDVDYDLQHVLTAGYNIRIDSNHKIDAIPTVLNKTSAIIWTGTTPDNVTTTANLTLPISDFDEIEFWGIAEGGRQGAGSTVFIGKAKSEDLSTTAPLRLYREWVRYEAQGDRDFYNSTSLTKVDDDTLDIVCSVADGLRHTVYRITRIVGVKYADSTVIKSPGGTYYKLKVADDGTLSTEVF